MDTEDKNALKAIERNTYVILFFVVLISYLILKR